EHFQLWNRGGLFPFNTSFREAVIKEGKLGALSSVLHEIFYQNNGDVTPPTSLVLVSPFFNTETKDENFIQLALNMLRPFSLPTISYLPFRTEHELDNHLLLHLEPNSWHVANLVVDLMKKYDWSSIACVYNQGVTAQQQWQCQQEFRVCHFYNNHQLRFEISMEYHLKINHLKVEKMNLSKKITEYMLENGDLQPYMNMFRAIERQDSQIIFLNINDYELSTIMDIYEYAKMRENDQILQLFSSRYVWIFAPNIFTTIPILDLEQHGTSIFDHTVNKNLIPGLFEPLRTEKLLELAQQTWCRSLSELSHKHGSKFAPPQQGLNSPYEPAMASWDKSFELYKQMASVVKEKKITLNIYNSQTDEDRTISWRK
ncbi:hypothetical protein Ciccas_013547, partial [Cichlidogyrus casuarinus]